MLHEWINLYQAVDDLGSAGEATVVEPDKEPVEEVPNEEEKEGEETEIEEELDPVSVEALKRLGIEGVEYPEGVEADSVDGIYHAFQTLVEKTENDVLTNFKATYPDAYRLALWMQNGNALADFDRTMDDPTWETIKDNVDVQKQLYLRSLKEKGFDDEEAELALQNKIRKETLAESVQNYLKDGNDRRKAEIERLEAKTREQEGIEIKENNDFDKALKSLFNKKVLSLLTLPDAKVNESYTKFVEQLVYNGAGQGFTYAVHIDSPEKLEKLIQMNHIMNNEKDFFKNREQQIKENKSRVIERAQTKVKEEAKTATRTGLDPRFFLS